MRVIFATTIILFILIQNLYASGAFPIEDSDISLIGKPQIYTIKGGETLIELAREFDLGYNEIISANRDIDPWVPEKGTEVLIPTSWIIPEILNEGILINLAEMRLYFFFSLNNKRYAMTFPVGIGREGFNTPEGIYSIVKKVKDPVWNVPESIRRERPELPAYIPPGPDNPLGSYWLQLSIKAYGIHGTNRPYGIGRRTSHGCIRLYPEDIKVLVRYTSIGTPVKIINAPVKVIRYQNKVYIEVSSNNLSQSQMQKIALEELGRKHLLKNIDTKKLMDAIENPTGLPTAISN
jgi:L,D-transpeptidase ErfK/SrfK